MDFLWSSRRVVSIIQLLVMESSFKEVINCSTPSFLSVVWEISSLKRSLNLFCFILFCLLVCVCRSATRSCYWVLSRRRLLSSSTHQFWMCVIVYVWRVVRFLNQLIVKIRSLLKKTFISFLFQSHNNKMNFSCFEVFSLEEFVSQTFDFFWSESSHEPKFWRAYPLNSRILLKIK